MYLLLVFRNTQQVDGGGKQQQCQNHLPKDTDGCKEAEISYRQHLAAHQCEKAYCCGQSSHEYGPNHLPKRTSGQIVLADCRILNCQMMDGVMHMDAVGDTYGDQHDRDHGINRIDGYT